MCKKQGIDSPATTKVNHAIGMWSMQCELHAAKAHREQKRIEVLDKNKIIRHNAMQIGGKKNAIQRFRVNRLRRFSNWIGGLVESYL
jgi:hypothetical protein